MVRTNRQIKLCPSRSFEIAVLVNIYIYGRCERNIKRFPCLYNYVSFTQRF